MSCSFMCRFTFMSTSRAGIDRLDRLIPPVEPSDGWVHVLPFGIVNVTVNGMIRPAGRGPCVLKIIHAMAPGGGGQGFEGGVE
ncbi:hypothetical protein JCM14469_06930 [Desulfatiferula olefinivorans]